MTNSELINHVYYQLRDEYGQYLSSLQKLTLDLLNAAENAAYMQENHDWED